MSETHVISCKIDGRSFSGWVREYDDGTGGLYMAGEMSWADHKIPNQFVFHVDWPVCGDFVVVNAERRLVRSTGRYTVRNRLPVPGDWLVVVNGVVSRAFPHFCWADRDARALANLPANATAHIVIVRVEAATNSKETE